MLRTALLVVVLSPFIGLSACGDKASGPDVRNNQIKVIEPYRAKGTWVFDDVANLGAGEFCGGVVGVLVE